MKADIYHITGDVNYLAVFLPKNKVILTIHDIGHYLYDLKGMKRFLYGLLWFRIPIIFTRTVTTVSEYSKKNVQRCFSKKTKIVVVKNCFHPEFLQSGEISHKTEIGKMPQILQIGTTENKNLNNVVNAISSIECELTVIGALDEKYRILMAGAGIVCYSKSNLSRSQIIDEYRRCDIVVFASKSEGFGLPVLEAQVSCRPVVTSDLEPMNSIAGDGAILVSPDDPAAIRNAIIRLCTDNAYRLQLVERGRLNASKYRPEIVYQKYLDLYTAAALNN